TAGLMRRYGVSAATGPHESLVFTAARVEVARKGAEALFFDRVAHRLHQGKIVVQIMNRPEPRGQNFSALVQVAQIRPAVMRAGIAAARFVERPRVRLVAGIADLEHTRARE